MKRLTRGTIREARNILTLTRARTGGSSVVGMAVPQPTAQNQVIISNATPAWTLLAAPAAQGQVLITGPDPYTPAWAALFNANVPDIIQPDDTATAGSAATAARRDHTHGIVCVAPASPSVFLAASAEGSGTSFARADHAHQLDQAIVPTWSALHTFSAGITLNGATGANTIAIPDGATEAVSFADSSGIEYLRIGTTYQNVTINEDNEDIDFCVESVVSGVSLIVQGSDGYVGIATVPAAPFHVYYLARFDSGITFGGESSLNIITVPDNAAQAAHLVDAGAIEYLRIVSTNTQPVVVFNEGGADVDFRVEASGQPNALFLRGSDGYWGMGTSTPVSITEIKAASPVLTISDTANNCNQDDVQATLYFSGRYSSGVADPGADAYSDAAIKSYKDSADGTGGAGLSLWTSLTGTGGLTEQVRIDKSGHVTNYEDGLWVRFSGTIPIQFGISEPIVETFGQFFLPYYCTVIRVSANVIGGTSCTFNIEERSTLGSAGTNILSSDMVADANGEIVTSGFNNSSLAASNYLTVDISAVSGAVECVSITLVVTID